MLFLRSLLVFFMCFFLQFPQKLGLVVSSFASTGVKPVTVLNTDILLCRFNKHLEIVHLFLDSLNANINMCNFLNGLCIVSLAKERT